MIRKNIHLSILFCFILTSLFSNTWLRLDSIQLAKVKIKITNGTASEQTLNAYNQLVKNANKLLTHKNPTVIDKTILPPTANKHDYLSISRYWWPDYEKKDGLPWIKKDGKTNPDTQTNAVDRKRLGAMGQGVWKLSLAYYFTDDEKYAEKAISMLNTWFLNPETLMNPHLEFGQSIPGRPNKRPFGILDGRSIVRFVPDAINLLSISKYWKVSHKTKMNTWFSNYLTWLTTSDIGIKGSLLKNNHGSWYKFQVASLAFYLGDKPLVKKMVALTQLSLKDMLDTKGGQIHELARTRSFFYSCFNLQALTSIADIGDKIGMNMWQYETKDKKSLTLAINYLTPMVTGTKWPYETLKDINLSGLIPIISKAYKKENSKEYKKILVAILKDDSLKKKNDRSQEFWLLNSEI